jgi:molybdate transport system substrate-binding protein
VGAEEAGPAIAAASDLKFALEEIAAQFLRETGRTLRLTFGSSGNFARQLQQGAPFELFLCADDKLVFELADQGLTRDRGVEYGRGRLALFAPHSASWKVDAAFTGLRRALAEKRIAHFAIANPAHAPYGRAAEQALRSVALWPALEPLLVLGDSVAQAAQFASSGSADGGIIALSLALAPPMRALGSFALIPERHHAPLRQRMVLMRHADETAQQFYAYLQRPSARDTLVRYGFEPASGAR